MKKRGAVTAPGSPAGNGVQRTTRSPLQKRGEGVAYDLEEGKVRRFLKQYKSKRAAIQLPSGLRPELQKIVKVFEEAGAEPVIMSGSCYGACDLAGAEAKRLGCDALVHYGHADMRLTTCLPTLYVEARIPADPTNAVESALHQIEFKRVGLLTTVQHVAHLQKIAELLYARGFKPFVGKPGRRAKYSGQLLGCDFGCARSVAPHVDGFLYVGTGDFHPLGAALTARKEVLAVNPISGDFKSVAPNIEAFLHGRKAVIARAAAGGRFGIIMGTKPGQARFALAKKLIESFKCAGRDAYLLTMDEVRPEGLDDFRLDAFVCTACPRIPIDDAERFERPVLTPFEAGVLLGEAKFEYYEMDEFAGEDLSREKVR